uniref:Uncharacterized protein n=1 Tax=Octopus bimaculoides TaxID=37653 RepID=A0A0L8G3V5_OCTBM
MLFFLRFVSVLQNLAVRISLCFSNCSTRYSVSVPVKNGFLLRLSSKLHENEYVMLASCF